MNAECMDPSCMFRKWNVHVTKFRFFFIREPDSRTVGIDERTTIV